MGPSCDAGSPREIAAAAKGHRPVEWISKFMVSLRLLSNTAAVSGGVVVSQPAWPSNRVAGGEVANAQDFAQSHGDGQRISPKAMRCWSFARPTLERTITARSVWGRVPERTNIHPSGRCARSSSAWSQDHFDNPEHASRPVWPASRTTFDRCQRAASRQVDGMPAWGHG